MHLAKETYTFLLVKAIGQRISEWAREKKQLSAGIQQTLQNHVCNITSCTPRWGKMALTSSTYKKRHNYSHLFTYFQVKDSMK